ncbi:GNAT family N-acetyltransferase [Metabacillus halosaccharovorans]|uniref:GNAT family N-acetyltransferase n=1 Tax=Metabacillus halosaccharovorans TaxID=930124 RepID=UPI001C1F80D8|nr:GNAT family N-acetyltransferase [Metabacillus halosaccharovorans]
MINSKIIHPFVRELLAIATSDFKVDLEYQIYLNSFNRELFGFELQGEIIGCIGIENIGFNECVIKHIAVSPVHREKGIGSKMIDYLSEEYILIIAETDKDVIDFYRKYGFSITSLGEKYPGVERFLCEYKT